jgi:DnaK suppressor protein
MNQTMNQAKRRLTDRRLTLMRVQEGLRSDAAEPRGNGLRDPLPVSELLLTALSERERLELNEVNAALARIEEGSWGSCEQCGKPIGRSRLHALPEARRCIQCSSEDPQRAQL